MRTNDLNQEHNGRSLAGVLAEVKEEVKSFMDTRVQMLRSEVNQKVSVWKAALPMLVIAAVVGWGAFLVLTFGLVALVAAFFEPHAYAWVFGAGIIFLLYAVIAAAIGWMGYKELKAESLTPERTLRVLKQDQAWIQEEARSA
jgi:hypothetical protein